MKYVILLFILTIQVFVAKGQEDSMLAVVPPDSTVALYPNGAIKFKGVEIDGEKQGIWQYFYENGKRNATEQYYNGLLHGESRNYDFDGNLLSIENWEFGLQEDSAFYFYPQGQIKRKGAFNKGLYEGEWLGYHVNGNLSQKGSYKTGMPEGNWFFFSENGALTYEITYKKGKESGPYKEYHPDGYLLLAGEMYEGKRIGVWRKYNRKGKVRKTFRY